MVELNNQAPQQIPITNHLKMQLFDRNHCISGYWQWRIIILLAYHNIFPITTFPFQEYLTLTLKQTAVILL